MPPSAVTSPRPVLVEHVTAVPVGDELVLHEAGSGRLHLLDRMAAAVVGLFDGNRTLAEVIDAVTAVFDGRPERISDDIHGLVSDLQGRGVLRLTR